MALAYLSLGTNLGEKEHNLENAIIKLKASAGTLIRRSTAKEYPSWGYESENDFLNMALLLRTELDPMDLLKTIKDIEREMGRFNTTNTYQDRIIDIDILFMIILF